jgi:hypothetical protein
MDSQTPEVRIGATSQLSYESLDPDQQAKVQRIGERALENMHQDGISPGSPLPVLMTIAEVETVIIRPLIDKYHLVKTGVREVTFRPNAIRLRAGIELARLSLTEGDLTSAQTASFYVRDHARGAKARRQADKLQTAVERQSRDRISGLPREIVASLVAVSTAGLDDFNQPERRAVYELLPAKLTAQELNRLAIRARALLIKSSEQPLDTKQLDQSEIAVMTFIGRLASFRREQETLGSVMEHLTNLKTISALKARLALRFQ